jgi:predicted transcriptional regulator
MKRTVLGVVTRPVVTVNAFAPFKDIVRRMQDYRVSAVPVGDEDDIVLGIVSRATQEIREDVIRGTLWIDPHTIRVVVREGVVTMEGQLERRSLPPIVERLVLSTEGVVAFESRSPTRPMTRR